MIPRNTRVPSLRRMMLAQLMRLANQNPNQWWFKVKEWLLSNYAAADGFDTQRIEHPCWTCGGPESEERWDCYDCDDGVHHVTRVLLRRRVIEGVVFRKPLHRFETDAEMEDFERCRAGQVWHRRLTGKAPVGRVPVAVSWEAAAWCLVLTGQWPALRQWLVLMAVPGLGTTWRALPLLTLAHGWRRLLKLRAWWRVRWCDEVPF